jgi:hypothetical protein
MMEDPHGFDLNEARCGALHQMYQLVLWYIRDHGPEPFGMRVLTLMQTLWPQITYEVDEEEQNPSDPTTKDI